MEKEDDDFYDPADTVPPAQAPNHAQNRSFKPQESGDAEEEEVEVEDDEVCSRRAEGFKELERIVQFFRMILILLPKHHQMLLHQRCE